MNLHNVAFAITNAAIWLTVVGRNGRSIGDHLWEIPEGTPPPLDLTHMPNYNNYWTPPHFAWQPFTFNTLMREGYVPPLCGRRSNSLRPRINTGWGNNLCEACITVANRRGIIPLTYNQAQQQSAIYRAVAEERDAWQRAGRPREWPLPSPTT